jgi:spore maturation protein CgeB
MKTLAVILVDDYGEPEKGESYEFHHFVPALAVFGDVTVFDFGPYLQNTKALQPAILAAAESTKPDLIFFVLYQDQFEFKTLDALKGRWRTMNWFCDDQWRYEGFSRLYAPHFTEVVTTDDDAHRRYLKDGVKAHMSQWAATDILGKWERPEYRFDVSFVGWRNEYRAWFVDYLSRHGIKVECFGTGWPNGRITYADMNRIFRESRINLNLSNSKNYDVRYISSSQLAAQEFQRTVKDREQVKGRHFEICGAGGFQLTNYVRGLTDAYLPGECLAAYASPDDAIDQIKYYLEHVKRREEMAESGWMVTQQIHSYAHRFHEFIGCAPRAKLTAQESATCH